MQVYYYMRVFYTSFNWWLFTEVQVIANSCGVTFYLFIYLYGEGL